MVKIKDRLGELVGKFVRITLKDKTEFELKPTEEHKRKLLFNYKKDTENDLIFTNHIKMNTLTKEVVKERDEYRLESYNVQNEVVKGMLKESYPDFGKEQIENIMGMYDTELLEEIYFFYGWIDKEIREAQRKASIEAIKKLGGEEENPEKKLDSKKQSGSDQKSDKDN